MIHPPEECDCPCHEGASIFCSCFSPCCLEPGKRVAPEERRPRTMRRVDVKPFERFIIPPGLVFPALPGFGDKSGQDGDEKRPSEKEDE